MHDKNSHESEGNDGLREQPGDERGFKVKDLRRFDNEGNERGATSSDSPLSSKSPSSAQNQGASSIPAQKRGEDHAGEKDHIAQDHAPMQEQGDITFSSFVISLATQALMQLGEIRPPDGVDVPIDRAAAQQTIDIITMLKKKTTGNLSPDEVHLVEEILHNLRLSFIRVRS